MAKSVLDEIDQRTSKLISVLNELACDLEQSLLRTNSEKNTYYTRLDGIYRKLSDKTDYRHPYSEIFILLSELDNNEKASIDILVENLLKLYEFSRTKTNQELALNIQKLYDHVNLDVARINYIKKIDRRFSMDRDTTKNSISEMNSEVSKMKENVEEYIGKVDNSQKEYVTILGIFASVVVTFTGGVTFASSVLSNIGTTTNYRVIFVALILGIIIFNVIYCLLDFLKHINKSMPGSKTTLLIVNGIFIGLLILVGIAYYKDWLHMENALNELLKTKK